MARSREFLPLAPLGERVASHRRCHQPGREGGPTFCLCAGEGVNNRGHGGNHEWRASLSHHAFSCSERRSKSRKRSNFATRQRTPNKRRGATFSNGISRRRRNICAKNLGRRVVATGGVWIRRSIMDPLTRLAPADESAGCDPPSPPRGRGQGILRIERFANVETPDAGLKPGATKAQSITDTVVIWRRL